MAEEGGCNFCYLKIPFRQFGQLSKEIRLFWKIFCETKPNETSFSHFHSLGFRGKLFTTQIFPCVGYKSGQKSGDKKRIAELAS